MGPFHDMPSRYGTRFWTNLNPILPSWILLKSPTITNQSNKTLISTQEVYSGFALIILFNDWSIFKPLEAVRRFEQTFVSLADLR